MKTVRCRQGEFQLEASYRERGAKAGTIGSYINDNGYILDASWIGCYSLTCLTCLNMSENGINNALSLTSVSKW